MNSVLPRDAHQIRESLQVVMHRTKMDPAFERLRLAGSEFVAGDGYAGARVMVVGSVPSAHDVAEGRPFSGPAGELAEQMLRSVGLGRARVWSTLTHKYMPSATQPPTFKELRAAKFWLEMELMALDPDVVVLFGVQPLTTFFPGARMSTVQGRTIIVRQREAHSQLPRERTFVALSNPTVALRDRAMRTRIGEGMQTVRHLVDVPRDFAHA